MPRLIGPVVKGNQDRDGGEVAAAHDELTPTAKAAISR
jgi:hypothetical protein